MASCAFPSGTTTVIIFDCLALIVFDNNMAIKLKDDYKRSETIAAQAKGALHLPALCDTSHDCQLLKMNCTCVPLI